MKATYKGQERLIDELIEVYPGVLVLQLNNAGHIESVQQLARPIEERIEQANSSVVVVDLTNTPTIDTQTTHNIIDFIRAARRLGAQVILIGRNVSIHREVMHLGVDLSGIKTCFSLAAGLWAALDIMESEAANKTNRTLKMKIRQKSIS